MNLISLYISTGVHQHADIEHTTSNKARNADGYKVVAKDDIIVNILLCRMGAIGYSDYNGVALNDSLIKFVSDEYLNTAPNVLVEKEDFIWADTSEDLAECDNCTYIDWDGSIFAGYHSIIMHFTHKQGNNNKYFAYLFKSPAWRKQVRKRVNAVKVYSITQQF